MSDQSGNEAGGILFLLALGVVLTGVIALATEKKTKAPAPQPSLPPDKLWRQQFTDGSYYRDGTIYLKIGDNGYSQLGKYSDGMVYQQMPSGLAAFSRYDRSLQQTLDEAVGRLLGIGRSRYEESLRQTASEPEPEEEDEYILDDPPATNDE